MRKTRGKTPAPAPREVIRDVVENAAFTLYFDIGKEARKKGTVDISIVDVKEPHWKDTTHEFYIVFNKSAACYVGRRSDSAYVIQPDRENPYFAQELAIRDQVLDVALQHFTGKSHIPESTSRLQLAQELLEGNMTIESDHRPIVQDELPVVLSPDQGETQLQPERQWSVRIGRYYCTIGLFGTDDDGNLKLVPISDKQ